MKIAVTGSAGFLGGHVARHLFAQGHEVKGIDLVGAHPVDFTKATPRTKPMLHQRASTTSRPLT